MWSKLSKKTMLVAGLSLAISVCIVSTTHAATVTGDPVADGWAYQGHSLEKGTYVRGSGNIGFEIYTAKFTVSDGSLFTMSSPDSDYYEDLDPNTATPWQAGDKIVAVGGVFRDISAADSGWSSFPASLTNVEADDKLRLQAKFGPSNVWWASTVEPGSGDGSGSSSNSFEFVRTSGWLHPNDTNNYTNWWATFSGEMMGPQNNLLYGPGEAARLIWQWDSAKNRPGSWQILLNTSMYNYPGEIDTVVSSVQYDNPYTDGIATVVPEPATLSLLALGGLAMIRRRRA